MSNRKPLLNISKKSLVIAWVGWSGAASFISSALSLAFNNSIPDSNPYKKALPFIVFISIAAVSAIGWIILYFWGRYRAAQIWVPKGEVVEYTGRPYEVGSDDLAELSKFANEAFNGDTMPAELVQHAVEKKCAFGIRLTDSEGSNIGFFDVFHLRDNAREQWIEGTLSEPDLRKEHFEPIRKPAEDGETLKLIIGAIYIAPGYRTSEHNLAFAFAESCQRYLWQRCAGFKEIILFASIFSEQGDTLARRFYKFENHRAAANRKGVGKMHDVLRLVLRQDDPIVMRQGLGGANHVIVKVKSR